MKFNQFFTKIIFISFIVNLFEKSEAKLEINKNINKLYSEEFIADIDLKNFDIREKFYDCYNPGYDADLLVFNIFGY